MNFRIGRVVEKDGPVFESEGIRVPLSNYRWVNGTPTGQEVEFGLRPEHISIGGNLPNRHEAEVELVEPMGAETIVWCRLAGQSLSVRVEGESAIAAGAILPVGFPIERVNLFDAKTGLRL